MGLLGSFQNLFFSLKKKSLIHKCVLLAWDPSEALKAIQAIVIALSYLTKLMVKLYC